MKPDDVGQMIVVILLTLVPLLACVYLIRQGRIHPSLAGIVGAFLILSDDVSERSKL